MARKNLGYGAFEENTEEVASTLKKNFVVKTQIARVRKPRNKPGPKRSVSVRQFENGINSYFRFCENNDRTPSIKGLMLHMKMMREAFYSYIKDPEYQDILEQCKVAISEWIENDIYRTPGQAAGKIAYAKNVIDWTERIDTHNTNETTVTQVLTVDQARAKIASLAHLINPELLEAVARPYTLNQIAHQEAEVEPS